jgi:5-(aminomethyl)-3-furanmethanol phosphate kinase
MNNRIVLKLGGSLLLKPGVAIRLREWLSSEFNEAQVNLIVGGGNVIEAMREWDRIHTLDPIAMHWRCIRALRHTYELVAEWLPNSHKVETAADFENHLTNDHVGGVFLIAIDSFYTPSDGGILPQDWSTTSDSIAALLATKLSIKSLWLLKSCEVRPHLSVDEAVSAGIVDRAFSKASRNLHVQWATL